MQNWQLIIVGLLIAIGLLIVAWKVFAGIQRERKNYERALKMVPMLIHLPPSTDDIQGGGRDERDVINEQISEAQVMYSIISSTLKKGLKGKLYGQRHISFELVAHDGLINYYATVPAALTETVKQAITAAYPTARMEEVADPNFFSATGKIDAVAGGELRLKEDYYYPIATYEDTKRDASLGLINAMSVAKPGDGLGIQIMFRPTDGGWTRKSLERVQNIKDGKKSRMAAGFLGKTVDMTANFVGDVAQALWKPPDEHEYKNPEDKVLTNLQQEEITKIEEKTKSPGFEVYIRIVASCATKARSEALLSGVVSVFSQFDLANYNGFRYDIQKSGESLAKDYILRIFPQERKDMILNSVEMASIFHLPSQNSIPTSQVERQATKQVDGPAKLPEDGVILGVNKFRGEEKIIRLRDKDRRRHTYVIGSTGMGKSILLTNIAYQDMCDGRGFAFIDPHGDAVELLLSKVPPERMDDVILFEPGNLDNPVGMNMFEFQNEDQKDFIVQEGINMLTSLYDPGNQGIFGPRAQHMFRNAALLLMSDPDGGTFIDIPRCFIDPEFVKSKLKYVTDKTVYDYWTKEFPASQKSNDAGEVTSWFVSKWGPFLSNKMMRNILGQPKSGFNIRELMDNKKILLVNLSKGKTGELNAKLLGMIFVMKFQAAAMSRADMAEDDREDFCLFVDEFQNFATESFESILSEARKYRLNLVLANQFMTQLTDKIREALLGNVGTLMSGRLGVTDAELMEKAFSPVFTAEDLHKQANFSAIATVMMFDMPTSPFTMSLLPPMGDSSDELMRRMREYALSRFGRPRAEVEAEIDKRLAAGDEEDDEPEMIAPAPKPAAAPMAVTGMAAGAAAATAKPAAAPKPAAKPKKNFLDSWLEKKANLEKQAREEVKTSAIQQAATPQVVKPTVTTQAGVADQHGVSAIPAAATQKKEVAAPKIVPKKAQMVGHNKPAVPSVPVISDVATPKNTAADKILANPTGSIWAATAAQNAMRAQATGETTPAPAQQAASKAPAPAPKAVPTPAPAPAPAAPADPTSFKIQHDYTQRNNVIRDVKPVAPAPAPVAQAQPVAQATPAAPVAPAQTSASGGIRATSDGEDGVVLRWR